MTVPSETVGADAPIVLAFLLTVPSTETAPNSLIVTGQGNKGEAVPSINLDKLLSEQSGAPTVGDSVAEKH
jgi:hypothetical protein